MTLTILFSGSLERSSNIDIELPSLSMDVNTGSHLTSTIPSLSLEAHSGKQFIANLPSMTLSLTGESLVGGQLLGQFPRFTFSGTISITDPEPMEITLPALSAAFYTGGSVSDNLPSLELTFSGNPGRVIDFVSTLPSFSFDAFAAGDIGINLPMFIQTMEATTNVLASISSVLPRLGMTGNLFSNYTGTIDADLPALQLVQNCGSAINLTLPSFSLAQTSGSNLIGSFPRLSLVGNLSHEESVSFSGDIVGQLPSLSFTGEIIWDCTVEITADLPRLRISVTGIEGPVGSIEANLPQFELYGEVLPGNIASMELNSILKMKMNITANPTGEAQIEASFLPMDMMIETVSTLATTVDEEVGILRYQKERIR